MRIGNFEIGKDRTFIIAELSANHNGSLEKAKETIKAAKESGADAIKIQTYTADTLTIDCKKEDFKISGGTLWDEKTLYELYKEAYTPWEWHAELFETAKNEGLICFSSPFDKTAVDFLEELNTPAYKIASFEITDTNLIEYAASKGKPIIISTGIAGLSDIELAVKKCRNTGNEDIALLKCTSAYPAPVDEANLIMINHLSETFKVTGGLSDHTEGIGVAVAAVALGAKIVEKHFILDRSGGGPDSAFSMEPNEFKTMVSAIRQTEKAVGYINYDLSEKVIKNRQFARSLYVIKDVKKGDVFTSDNIRSIRPGYGLHPKYYNEIIGKKATVDIERGTPLKLEYFS